MPALTLLTLALLPAARAAVALHDGRDPDAAAARVEAVTGARPAPLTLGQLDENVGAIGVVGNARREDCDASPISGADLHQAIADAEGDINYGRFDEAAARLDAAVAGTACLADPAVPADLARLFFLRGVLHMLASDPSAAFAAFRQAVVLVPDLGWDEAFAPERGKDLFDSARAARDREGTTWVAVMPPSRADALRVDGLAWPADTPRLPLYVGRHLVQVVAPTTGVASSAWVTVAPGQEARIVPLAALADADLRALRRESGRAELAVVAAAALPDEDAVYAVLDGSVWRLDQGRWVRLARQPGRTPVARGVRYAGLGLTAGGAAWTGLAWAAAAGHVRACAEGTPEDCAAHEAPYRRAAALVPVGEALLGAGLVAVGGSYLLDGRVRVAPAVIDGGAGLRLTVGGRR